VTIPAREEPAGARKLGRFTVIATLGTGAMGEVLRARDERLGREVAIKTVRNVFGLHADLFKQRFEAEARALAALSHGAIVQVHDLGIDEASGEPYLVMELVDGPSLKEKLQKDGVMSVGEVRVLGIQLARALEAAHARKILHRDIKPANILLSPTGQWKLADFGVAHVPDSSMTMTGQFLGTPAYAAPESVALGQFSEASDVFSVAVTLIEAMTGERVRGDANLSEIVQHSRDLIRLPAGVPPDMAEPLRAALALDPLARPSGARLAEWLAAGTSMQMAAAVPRGEATAFLGPPVAASSTAPGTSGVRPLAYHRPDDQRRRRMFWIIGGVAGLLLLVGLIAAATSGQHAASATTPPTTTPARTQPAATQPVVDDDGDPQKAFDAAVEDARAGRLEDALKKLDAFEERYGESDVTHDFREDLEDALEGGGGHGKGHKKKRKKDD
jgi:serine/threonine-protein kinase